MLQRRESATGPKKASSAGSRVCFAALIAMCSGQTTCQWPADPFVHCTRDQDCPSTHLCSEAKVCVDVCGRRECGTAGGVDCGACPGTSEYCDDEGRCRDACYGVECGTWHGVECGTCLAPEFCTGAGLCEVRQLPGDWVTIQAGTFVMGSPVTELGRDPDETQHQVTLTRDFEITTTEVTQADFNSMMLYNPSLFASCGPNCPVERVSWHEAAAYCNALSDTAGLPGCYSCTGSHAAVDCQPVSAYVTPYDCPGYRLPTEAEWEYAARAGTTTATCNGDLDDAHLGCEVPNSVLDPIAWFCGDSGDNSHPVATRDPNAWGLYDMSGNLWEWSGDWYQEDLSGSATDPWGPATGTSRVIRGGAFSYHAKAARSANRSQQDPVDRHDSLGFRPARTLP